MEIHRTVELKGWNSWFKEEIVKRVHWQLVLEKLAIIFQVGGGDTERKEKILDRRTVWASTGGYEMECHKKCNQKHQ